MTDKNYYLIADLHLSEARPDALKLFAHFLKEITSPDNILFILGDFFDYWVGDDAMNGFQRHAVNLLAYAHDGGLIVYFMHGNRDFLIGKRFAQQAKLTLISDPFVLKLKHKSILLMHGDLLCTDDKSYQLFRKIARNSIIKSLYLALPLKIRQAIAQKIRLKSKQKNEKYKIIDVTEQGIQQYLTPHRLLIHGHTHLFNAHHKKHYTRYVLGDWFINGSYIHIDSDENITLKKI